VVRYIYNVSLTRVRSCEICGGHSGTAAVPPILRFIAPTASHSSSSGADAMRQRVAAAPSGHRVSRHSSNIKVSSEKDDRL
jgi:hypothetical protein